MLTVDGWVYQWQSRGGVSRLFTELLPRMCDLEPTLSVTLMTEGKAVMQSFPQHERIFHRRLITASKLMRPQRLFGGFTPIAQRLLRRWLIGTGRHSIWHSTYYTKPEHWKGRRVVTVYDLAYHRLPHLFNTAADRIQRDSITSCIREADLVIAISEATRSDLIETMNVESAKIRTVPLAHSETFRRFNVVAPEPAVHPDRPFVLFVGDRNHYKNFAAVLEAFRTVAHRRNVQLVVVGPPKWSSAELFHIRRLKLESKVSLVGRVSDDELAMLYNRAVAFVHASLIEGFGIPLLEAMACGCTVVASKIPSTLEVAADYPIYFDPLDVDSLIAALDRAFEGGEGGQIANGANRAMQYSWRRTAEGTLNVYRELSS